MSTRFLSPIDSFLLIFLRTSEDRKVRQIQFKSNCTISKMIDDAFKKSGVNYKKILESDNVDLIRSFIEEGFGISLLGNKLAESLLTAKTVLIPFREKITLQNGLAVPTTKGPLMPAVTKMLRDFTLKEITK